MHFLSILFTTALIALPLQTSIAGIYQWVGADGQTEYGDHPPVGSNARPIGATTANRNPDKKRQPLESRLQQMEAEKGKQDSIEAADAEMQRNAEIRKSNCETAKSNLEILGKDGARLKMPDGNFKQLTQDDKQPMIDQAKQQIKESCE